MPDEMLVQSLSGLLSDLGVTRVYWIDDATEDANKVSTILGFSELPGKLDFLRNELKKHNVLLDLDSNIIAKSELKVALTNADILESITGIVDEQLLKMTSANALYESALDRSAEKGLAALFQGVNYEMLSPKEWLDRRDTIIDMAQTERTFFVFDKLLGSGHPDGDQLMQSVIDENLASRPIFGLLSHTIEIDQETEMTRAFQVKGNATTAISKKLMRKENPLPILRQKIRSAVLYAEAKQLRDICETEIKNSVDTVLKTIGNLSASEFDQIIFQSSYREGIHEIETVLRIYANELVSSLRSRIRGNQQALEDVNMLRSYRGREKPTLISEQSIQIQQNEYYEPGDFVNSCLMPVEPGDVFEIEWYGNQKKREYVVVAQPCDLMVRSDGTRKLESVTLCPIYTGSPTKSEIASFKLDYYNSDNSEAKVVFKRAITFPCWILDCCSMNSDGICRFNTVSNAPTIIPEGMKELYKSSLAPKAKMIIDIHRKWMNLRMLTFKHKWITPPYIDRPNGCKVDVNNDELTMSVKRTRRITRSLTSEILISFGSNISRPAREHQLL